MNTDFSVQRANMVEGQLRTTDVTNTPLLQAMGEIPREAFVPSRKKALAYIDEDLEISSATGDAPARYLMEPSPFGKLIQLAEVQPSDVVLDIGTGSGYSAAVLSRLASFVVALECDENLAQSATETLSTLGAVNVAVVGGKLAEGYKDDAPYDVIFIGGAVDEVPAVLFDQLREGGRLVAVIGEGNAARAHVFVKDEGIVSGRPVFNVAVKPLPGFRKEAEFVF
ncbi:protein-L-isoaspartate O-methyltransferase family protein [Nitratireductor indicus]|uniref:Protein-L-isoaspartate O-methyltransferase n=1 Tax=Nitratireductor indicus C115 TaxID=1231190 RepID=K2N0D8_9HYPH|nr:protein-L-isoaspartate O-methyltransferase [Nitratireductor indicus]EKF40983.1 protein-L-isoaspartate(D-aspartate) O-methyltransferase [Nitratireductor indicus C115]MDS1135005.1 protein-L-isoaspartate O-methyltransferase [Nitratireductor indicus]SFQ73608.1 protein-L-isoaspartate(D-aspartate) O-methyltransferase [Nitratireductor indicus]